ncbi:MAG: 6,7-dimethyl-8-ribityllumazine synthase [Candidatus Altiarchaeota archaeon]|nr:6,7-dimethyl-8-ribityllumazine synthase [Candidatus Altiarchaeota archaeon]
MEKINLGIVAAEFNYDITYAMVELAKEHARFLDVDVEEVVRVPGVFDMPLAVKMLLDRNDVDCVVALGAVIEGQTEHDEIVAQHAARKIADLALDYGKPIGLGIAGPGMSRLDAHKRIEYAKRAVEAAVKMCKVLKGSGFRSKGGDEGKDDNFDINPNVGRFLEMG